MSDTRDRPLPLLERFERFLDAVIPPPDDIAEQVRRAEALMGAGDPHGALRIADSALAQAPGYLRALLLKADALAAGGAPYDALSLLDEAARNRRLPPEAFARMALYAATLGDERRALDLEATARGQVRTREPDTALRLLEAARVLLARGAVTAGLRLARGATRVDPALGAAWVLLAEDALRRGERVLAEETLARALSSLDPLDAAGNRTAGEIALALGQLTIATRHLRRAWIAGDTSAVAPLVVTLARTGDLAGLERVVADAEGSAAKIARALVELEQDATRARPVLERVHGAEVPEALWSLALESTLQSAPEITERWAQEAPERPGSKSVSALFVARRRLQEGDATGARVALEPALRDPKTLARAHAIYRDACRAAWRAQLAVMLEELTGLTRGVPSLATFENELRLRRRELDEPLRVAILGEFSAGKSTFLNALVGATVSPMGVLPTTAQVHWLRFGDAGARIVDARGNAMAATIAEAPRLVEKMLSDGERVDYVEVTMPVQRLARVELIDTPGFNAGDPAHEAAVRRAFGMADVALWLFDARQAGKWSESGPLAEARDAQLPVLGVLNKIDSVREADRAKLLDVVREGFHELAPLALALSSKEALAATLALADPATSEELRAAARERLVRSGMASFLAYLDEHLLAQRAAWKQLRVARRAQDLVIAAEAALGAHAVAERARESQREELLATLAALREEVHTTAHSVRKEVSAVLREQLRGLEGRRRLGRDGQTADSKALAVDAAAEIGFRARARALERLSTSLRAVEALAVAVGVVPASSAALVTAPVRNVLEMAATLGSREALEATPPPAWTPPDPFAALEPSVVQMDASVGDEHELLRIALQIAQEELASYRAPTLPELGA